MRISEVLPVPFGPRTARSSPGSSSKSSPAKSVRSPNRSARFSAATTLMFRGPPRGHAPRRGATLEGVARRERLAHGHDRDAGAPRRLAEPRGDGRDGLAVVEEHPDAVLRDELGHRGEARRGRLGSLLDRPRERVRREVAQPRCGDEVARHRLRVRDGRPVEARANRRDLAPEPLERAVEAGDTAAVGGCVTRVCALERGADGTGDAPEPRHVVPEVRVGVLAADAEDVRHRHDDAALAWRRVLQLRHEGVVAEPVLEHDPRAGDGEAVRRPWLEEVGVGVRAREDRRDSDVRAADLGGDVPVDVLGRHDVEPAARSLRAAAGGEKGHHGENDNGSHSHCELG